MNSFFSLGRAWPHLLLFVAFTAVALLPTECWVHAAESASTLAGVALPPGASRIVDAKTVKESVEPLTTIGANLETPVQVQATEVLAWGGADYKRDAGTKIITTVQAALQAAGFQTIKLGEPQNAQGSRISFFVAGATQKKKALLGYWLESDTLLMLVWGQVATQTTATNPLDIKQGGTVPQKPDAGVPAAANTNTITTLAGPQFPHLTAKPNEVKGAVRNKLGKPLSTAQIRFWRATPQGVVLEYIAHTNAQGIYSLTMPPASDYHLDNAIALVTYGEQRYFLPLRPEGDDGSFYDRDPIDTRKGYVKNFVLPISGVIAAELDPKDPLSYYGGSIDFRANLPVVVPGDPAMSAGATRPHAVPEGSVVELFLTPRGSLLDGSTGQPLSWKFQIRNNGRNAFSITLKDIPLGVYTATARITRPDGSTFQPSLDARIVLSNDISSTFTASADTPIFFAPRWQTWPQGNGGDPDSWLFVKRSARGGAGAVWLEPGD